MIEVVQRGRVALLNMVHGKVNSLDVEFCNNITEELEKLKTASSRSVVLIGNEKIFSAGVDLVRLLEEDTLYLETFLPALVTAFETLFSFPKPVVAAVNGHAIAGGCVLACAADYRLMARNAGGIGVPELRVGVPFPTIALEIMRFISPQHFQKIIYGGAIFSPEEAVALGLIDEIVEPHDLIDQAVSHAERLASIPAPTFGLTKKQIRHPALERVRESHSDVEPVIQDIWRSSEAREAIRDYVMRTFKRPH